MLEIRTDAIVKVNLPIIRRRHRTPEKKKKADRVATLG